MDDHDHHEWVKSHFDVMGLCCPSEVPLIEKIIKPLPGIKEVSVIVPLKTVIVVHDNLLISPIQIVKALNQARLQANVKVNGAAANLNRRLRLPSPYVIACGVLLLLSFLKYVCLPFQWLAVAAAAVGVYPLILRAFAAVRNLVIDVSVLILVAAAGTLALRDYWEAGFMIFVFTIAEWLEALASHKARTVMSSLMSIVPQQAVIAETGESVNVEDVGLNTVIAVKTGETIPIDGIVVDGNCEVDEKTLTGESFPVAKQKDSTVWAGTINLNGYITVKTTACADECVVARMVELVAEAQGNRSKTQCLIDEFAKYYTPAVILISACLAAVPAAMRVHNVGHWVNLALVVLVSACPCGLILSTPVATFCALSKAASSGLLIKGGDYLELLAKIKVVGFDKTGTITTGDFTLSEFKSLSDDISTNTLLYWVSSIESKSSHPIAAAIVNYGRSISIEPIPENVEEFQNFPGQGVSGKIDGRVIYVGTLEIGKRADYKAHRVEDNVAEKGRTLGYIFSEATLIGILSLSDTCRPGAKDAINELKAMSKRTAMLTGDSQAAADYAQEQLGNALDEIHARLLPEDKVAIIQGYQKKVGSTAMVGDGVNDAPALATADVGISMGISGSALAKETGQVILMSTDIRKIPKAIRLAQRSIRKVLENVIISMVTKIAVLALAFAGHPLVWVAVVADVGTCLAVTFNSMLLLQGTEDPVHECHPSSHKKCCFGRSHSSKASKKKCCSPETVSETRGSKCGDSCVPKPNDNSTCESRQCSINKKCSPTDRLSSETAKQCCSKKEAVKVSDNSPPNLRQCSSSKKGCSVSGLSSEAPHKCCSKKEAVKACDNSPPNLRQCSSSKRGCSISGLSSEAPHKCCSKKEAVKVCDNSPPNLRQCSSSKKGCSVGGLSSEAPHKCCSEDAPVDPCDPSGGGAHSHFELSGDNAWEMKPCITSKKCCSTSSDPAGAPKAGCAKLGAPENCDTGTKGWEECSANKSCCYKKSSPSLEATPVRCCSKKVKKEICEPSMGEHCHLELADDNTWKSQQCVIEGHQNDDLDCVGHCDAENKMSDRHEIEEEDNRLQASSCCNEEKNHRLQISLGLVSDAGTGGSGCRKLCCRLGDPVPSPSFSGREIGGCC